MDRGPVFPTSSVALAVRFGCPIYTFDHILESAGILMEDNNKKKSDIPVDEVSENMCQQKTEYGFIGEKYHPLCAYALAFGGEHAPDNLNQGVERPASCLKCPI